MLRTIVIALAVLLLLPASTASSSPTLEVKLLGAFISKRQGGVEVPHQPMVGERYRLTARYRIQGATSPPFKLRFRMANKTKLLGASHQAVGTHTQSFEFEMVLDDRIDFGVTLNPHRPDDMLKHPGVPTQTQEGVFRPREPSKGAEYFNPVRVVGTQQVKIVPTKGQIKRVIAVMGRPDTDSWQRMENSSAVFKAPGLQESVPGKLVENPGRHPVFAIDKPISQSGTVVMSQTFTLLLRDQRVSPTLLRKATWQQVDALEGLPILAWYLKPEAVIQSDHSLVRQFVEKAIGTNYRQTLTPYDAARKLFQAVLAHCTYTYPREGEKDQRAHNAVDLIRHRKGDCGGFSLLLVAVWRHIGIPARTACGVWEGKDKGHCWSEMFLPGGGWILSDGSAGNGQCEDGSYAYFFGTFTGFRNDHARMATMRGNTFNLSSPPVSTRWLQGPLVDVRGSNDLDYEMTSTTVVGRLKKFAFKTKKPKAGPSPRPVPPTALRVDVRRNGQRFEPRGVRQAPRLRVPVGKKRRRVPDG